MRSRCSLIAALSALSFTMPASAQVGVGGMQVGVPGAQALPERVLDPVPVSYTHLTLPTSDLV